MARDVAAELAAADRHLLVAPAGHGKSHAIAGAVALAGGKQLVLTHTHAGIRSLRKHLAAAGADPSAITLETIAGFATRWASPYPQLTGWAPEGPLPTWDGIYDAAVTALARPQLIDAVGKSYDGLFVDEYQDCTTDQHGLILRLAERLPTRLVGDPLQGIFSFGAHALVDFEADVLPTFTLLDEPDVAWRWQATNPGLGQDLLRLRADLIAGTTPDLGSFEHFTIRANNHPSVPVTTCKQVATLNGSTVVIRSQPGQAHGLAKQLGGDYVSMEESEGRDVLKAAQAIEAATGPARAVALLDAVGTFTTTVAPALAATRATLSTGVVPAIPNGMKRAAVQSLVDIAETESLAPVGPAIRELCRYPGVVIYRPEIPNDLVEAARLHQLSLYPTLLDATVAVRDRARRTGRQLARRVVSRTLLVKGLEFDHAIVFDSHSFNDRNLYVALTRSSQSVTIVR